MKKNMIILLILFSLFCYSQGFEDEDEDEEIIELISDILAFFLGFIVSECLEYCKANYTCSTYIFPIVFILACGIIVVQCVKGVKRRYRTRTLIFYGLGSLVSTSRHK